MTAVCVLALVPGAHSESYSATYVGASPGGVGLTSTAPGLIIPGSQFGGARFTTDGSAPLSVASADISGNPAYLVVCQDTNANIRCGEVGEPRVTGCGTVDVTSSAIAFDPDLDTIVFVYSTSLPGTSCVGTASTGTITLTTAL